MKLNNKLITKGFIIAGLMNASVLIFSKGFTNNVIPEIDPVVMSNFGLLMILIWGLAYISVAKNYNNVKWLVVVFAIEKLIYGIIWLRFIFQTDIASIYDKDLFAGAFYSIYGINDLLFFVFFTLVSFRLFKK